MAPSASTPVSCAFWPCTSGEPASKPTSFPPSCSCLTERLEKANQDQDQRSDLQNDQLGTSLRPAIGQQPHQQYSSSILSNIVAGLLQFHYSTCNRIAHSRSPSWICFSCQCNSAEPCASLATPPWAHAKPHDHASDTVPCSTTNNNSFLPLWSLQLPSLYYRNQMSHCHLPVSSCCCVTRPSTSGRAC